ncbi:MAG: alanine racemase [Planctomycetota bacterium]|nr:alanine racemase [Planctomycetota bacterium]MCX8040695.1 alanine racemase [Planctomycetota bacterium]MDW8373453.1 alanine racemase [Planctomycetota bacterium]
MAWRNRVEVSYGALRRNVAVIRALAAPRAVIAVVKADAYGLGLERCARIYHEAGVDAMACATIGEADKIRRVAPESRILLLGSPLPEERSAVVASGYEPCLSTIEEVHEFAQYASPHAPLPVHINVDTGMGRFGARPADALVMVREVLAWNSLRLAGIMTHYPMAENAEIASQQERTMAELLEQLPPLPASVWIHWHNSEGLLLRPAGPTTAVRVGLLLTGIVPTGCPDPGLTPALRWVSSLALVKHLPRGHGISYNRQYVLTRDSLTGIVPVGYADGYPIALSNCGSVLIQGHRCPVLGRVTMDYLIVDLTDLPVQVSPGEPVVLIGSQGGATISVQDIARLARTIPYDILCGLRGRCDIVGVP